MEPFNIAGFPPCPTDARTALLDGETPLHSVREVDLDDLPGPYPQIDRHKADLHGLWLGCEETPHPRRSRVGCLVTGDRLTFTKETS